MNGSDLALRSAHRMAYGVGLALCLGTPGLVSALLLAGVIPAGVQSPEGIYLQLGYLFTGFVFLSATWVWWRSAHALRTFQAVPGARRPSLILREISLYAAVLESSALCGLVYWGLVGSHAARHAWGFILMTPLLFLALVPRYPRWQRALEH